MNPLKLRQIFISAILLLLFITFIYSRACAWYAVCVNCKEEPSSSRRDWDDSVSKSTPTPQAPSAPKETQEQRNKRAVEINTRCVALHNNGELDNAISCYLKALALDPNNLIIRENMNFSRMMKAYYYGVHYYDQRDWRKAAQYFREALNYKYDENVSQYLRLTEAMLSEQEMQQRWEAERKIREEKLSEAQEKVRKMLDELKVVFDQRQNQPPSGLQFIEPQQTLFTKGDKNSAPVAVPTSLLRPGSGPNATGKETSAEIKQLEKEYWDLEEKIRSEKDPVKRAGLINRQSYIRSLMGVLEIKLMDKFKEEKIADEKDLKIKACLAIAASSTLLSDFNTAIKLLNDALAEAPEDKGIRMALNYVNYIKDMSEAKVSLNPQYPLLVDAISYGKGDWEVSISYLKKASNEYPEDKNIRAALKYIEGMRAEESVEKRSKMPTREDLESLLQEVASAVGEDKFEDAQSLIKQAQKLDPPDPILADLENIIKEIPVSKKEQLHQRRDDVHALTCRTIRAQLRNDYESAYRYIKEAYELDPDDPGVRDTFNFIQGIYIATKMKEKER